MEVAVILLVGFLVLGPGRSIDMARRTGKVLGDLRRTFGEVTDAIAQEERTRPQGRRRPPRECPCAPTCRRKTKAHPARRRGPTRPVVSTGTNRDARAVDDGAPRRVTPARHHLRGGHHLGKRGLLLLLRRDDRFAAEAGGAGLRKARRTYLHRSHRAAQHGCQDLLRQRVYPGYPHHSLPGHHVRGARAYGAGAPGTLRLPSGGLDCLRCRGWPSVISY